MTQTLDTPDEFLQFFPESTGLIGKGPFREVQVLIDGQLAGVVWPYGVIYTGGITPTNWRPLTSYGAYDSPTYWIDITPFLPQLLANESTHAVTLVVRGQGQSPSFNSNWFVSGSIHIRKGTSRISGKIHKYYAPELEIDTVGGVSNDNRTVWTRVTARRRFLVESELQTSEGIKVVTFSQALDFVNTAQYEDEGWLQVCIKNWTPLQAMINDSSYPFFSGLIKHLTGPHHLSMEEPKDSETPLYIP